MMIFQMRVHSTDRLTKQIQTLNNAFKQLVTTTLQKSDNILNPIKVCLAPKDNNQFIKTKSKTYR